LNRYIILGTAGHIDHGKSALIKALTGINPDRLKEEIERGITIDLGFAYLKYPDGLVVGIVDVPGHERLIKNMLAGAGGIDMVLMVVDAEEGIMPQTREHIAICSLLGITKGIVAITKSDIVEPDWLQMVAQDVGNLFQKTSLKDAEIIAVSALAGHNIDLLTAKIQTLAKQIAPKTANAIFRMPIDRVFTVKGFGAVVTGTAISGGVKVDDIVEILPQKITSKVRGLQVHDQRVDRAFAGQRVAVNLQGISKESITRGNVLVLPNTLKTTTAVDATVEMLQNAPPIKNGGVVHFHTGTLEITGRVVLYQQKMLQAGETALCQFRFKSPIAAMTGDRYIIRRFSPLETLGGGVILDSLPSKRKINEKIIELQRFETGDLEVQLETKIKSHGLNGLSKDDLKGWIKADLAEFEKALSALMKAKRIRPLGHILIHHTDYERFAKTIVAAIAEYHQKNPLKFGMPKENARTIVKGVDAKCFDSLVETLKEIVVEHQTLRLTTFSASLKENDKALNQKILELLNANPFQPPFKEELSNALSIPPRKADDILKLMASQGMIQRITDNIYITSKAFELMLGKLGVFFKKHPTMAVSEFRDLLGTTRKYALPFLEFLDANRITMRVGEVRKALKKDLPQSSR
jgi:selenocysteine-specific elongation factor